MLSTVVKSITSKMAKLRAREVIKMATRERLIDKIKALPEESLEEIADFIEFVGTKKRRKPETMSESMEGGEAEPLAQVIGICEGASDLAERHNKYIYRTR